MKPYSKVKKGKSKKKAVRQTAKKETIVFASDCRLCPLCNEPVCMKHYMHYADCPCKGPNSEDE